MNRLDTLRKLDRLLESFLQGAAAGSESGSRILTDMNRLDEIARGFDEGNDLSEALSGWLSEHESWMDEHTLETDDQDKLATLLGEVRRELRSAEGSFPLAGKALREVERWEKTTRGGEHKVVLKRGAEPATPPQSPDGDTIEKFRGQLQRLTRLFEDACDRRQHLMSVLDDTLLSASRQQNRDALLLSGLLIYYLKQSGYLVAPFVDRLKEAEKLLKGTTPGA